ncbi:MAG: hypothetical protein KF820_03100 [Candidatus Paracaedibacteraceae bacterium]|nr:hypothetical protein [Candidatus Paracaedibacteraceae bacterium]
MGGNLVRIFARTKIECNKKTRYSDHKIPFQEKAYRFMVGHQVVISSANVPELSGDTLLIACPIMIHNYGLEFYLGVWRDAQDKYPEYDVQLAVPCGDNLGLALRAIFSGVTIIYLLVNVPAFNQIIELAQLHGIEVLPQGKLNG